MINNAVTLARHELARHKALGQRSSLSIMEVAQLMDLVTFGPSLPQVKSTSVFFNYQAN